MRVKNYNLWPGRGLPRQRPFKTQGIMNEKPQEKIGFGMLKKSWFQILGYAIILVIIIFFTPPIWLSIIIIDLWIVIRALWYKTFQWWKTLKSVLFADLTLGVIYLVYWWIGGVPALILIHVIFIIVIIKGSWKFIKQADRQIKDQLDIIIEKNRRYKKWKTSQRRTR
jgi:hypothetical protein